MVKGSMQALTTVIVRAGATLLWVWMLASLPATLMWTGQAGTDTARMIVSLVIAAIVVGLLGLVGWVNADRIARALTAKSPDAPFESDIDAAGWQRIVLFGIGAWLAASGLVAFVFQTTVWLVRSEFLSSTTFGTHQWFNLVTPVVELLVGLALMIGARGIVGAVQRLRGRESPDRPSEDSDTTG